MMVVVVVVAVNLTVAFSVLRLLGQQRVAVVKQYQRAKRLVSMFIHFEEGGAVPSTRSVLSSIARQAGLFFSNTRM